MTDRKEQIAAFIDGALSETDSAAFEAELARDPALAAEVERLLANDDLLRAAFADPIAQGVDTALLSRMGLAEARPAAPVAANDNPPFLTRWRIPLGGAVAAALALTVTLGLLDRGGGLPLDTALDATPSGQLAALEDGTQLTPMLTFQAADGRYCREFSLGSGEQGGTGLACRNAGGWQVEALDQGATELAESGEIALAGGADGAGLDAAYARLGAGDPLGGAAETALIAGGWQNNRAAGE